MATSPETPAPCSRKDNYKGNLHSLHVGRTFIVAFGGTLQDAAEFIVGSTPIRDGQCAAASAKAVGEVNSILGRSIDG